MAEQIEGINAVLEVENVGGIRSSEVEFRSGVNLLVGENATNRTSLLHAVMAAFGSDWVHLRDGAETGRVELTLDGKTYRRTLKREGDSVRIDGEPPVDEIQHAELFAFLLESNKARQAVRTGNGFHELLFQPFNTEELETKIEQLEAELEDLREHRKTLESLEETLPELEARKERIAERLAEKKADREEKRQHLQTRYTAHIDSETEALEDKLDKLSQLRSQLDDLQFDIVTERESIESLDDERTNLKSEHADLPDVSDRQIELIDSQLEFLRKQRRKLDSIFNHLENIIQFNEELLSNEKSDLLDVLYEDEQLMPGSLTGEQAKDETLICWTCGSKTKRTDVKNMLETLTEISRKKYEERNSTLAEIDRLKAERQKIQDQQQEKSNLAESIDRINNEIEEREETIHQLETQQAALESRIRTLEEDIGEIEHIEAKSILELHETISDLDIEVSRLEDEYESLEERTTNIRERIASRPDVEQELSTVEANLKAQRESLNQFENRAISEFNEHIENLIGLLEYNNLERVYIKSDSGVEESPSSGDLTLQVVRQDGTDECHEGTVETLSESEREVVGLTLALAGYLTHEVYDTVPFMVLDSLEAIDSMRIERLVTYLSEYTPYLVVALLPEDASALSTSYNTITDI